MNRRFILWLIGLSLIMTLPLWAILAFKWPISTDLIFYATSLNAFSQQFWAGEIYPRWLMNTNAGFGSPVFVFYSPLPFYAMSFFEFLSPLDPHGFGRIFIGLMLSVMLAGITCYRWLALETDVKTVEKGALIYAGFPYLLLHMYGGFAVAQLWGIALFPLLLEASHDVAHKGWRSLPKLALAYSLLSATHLPSLLMFAAVPCLYVLVFSPDGKKIILTLLATASALLGIALAAICILPALLNKDYIASEHFLDGNLVYAKDFLDTWSQLGLVSVVLPLILLYLELPKATRRLQLTKPVRFWIAVEAVFLFMALPLSKPLWDALPPLQHLQFPFRFFLAMLPGTVFIALQFLPQVKSRHLYRNVFVIGLVCAVVYGDSTAFYVKETPIADLLHNHLLARPEYQTRWMENAHADFRLHVPEHFLQMKPASVTDGSGNVTIVSQDARNIQLHADITSPQATILLRRFYFPRWVAGANNFIIAEHDALLSLRLPRGSHDVNLSQPWFSGERESAAISIGAFLLWLTLAMWAMRPQRMA